MIQNRREVYLSRLLRGTHGPSFFRSGRADPTRGPSANSGRGSAYSQEFVEPRSNLDATSSEEILVRSGLQQLSVSRNALRYKGSGAGFLQERREVVKGRLVADLPIFLSTDEGQIANIVGLAARVTAFQNPLWKDMVELQTVLGP